ncbi:Rieske Fe-S protein [Streptacidiphilus sp. MAP12-20]|uniref:Rieske (2Fe-2S) protein n=1 Tax=Streptacidiphilus sp. MAP12-20 TaxID=3156299 RepID=UPI00351816C5
MTSAPTHDNHDTDSDAASAFEPTASRRTVLAGVGVVGATAVLAACSSGGSGGSSSGGGATAPTTTPPASTTAPATGGGSPSGPAASSPAAQGAALGPVSDVPVGGGKVYTTQKVVVTQPTANDFKCFTAICTHMGCTVASVSGGTINCPCHGSQYHITDGSVAHGPAPAPLAPEKITVSGGQISLA